MMKYILNISMIVLVAILVAVSDARFSDSHAVLKHRRHPVELSVDNVFFGERRHVGFGKFVGSGDVKPNIRIDEGSNFLSEILSRFNGRALRSVRFLKAWEKVIKASEEAEQSEEIMDDEPSSPSGPTEGWFYGSST